MTIVALMIVGATAGAFASGEKDRRPAFETLPPVSSDSGSTQPGCELGALECDDTPDTCEPVPLRSDCVIDPDLCNQVHNIDACDQDDFDRLGEDSSPPVSSDGPDTEPLECSLANDVDGCDDVVDSACEPVPLRSDCGIDPNECNKIHNITACSGPSEDGVGPIVLPGGGTANYEVVVRYNTSVTQPDLDETAGFLRGFDADLEFLVQESWPPTGVANLQTDTPNFCDAIFDELASRSYINDFSCGPQEKFDGDADPDSPVTNLPDVE
ncbi:MAG: hypothetical protein IH866_01475 [Chloroflexi bacterium]|nr:hypothetical protein [Chloroflexota bacterium]